MDKRESMDKAELKERARNLVSDAECQRYNRRELCEQAERLIDDAFRAGEDFGFDAATTWTPASTKPTRNDDYQVTVEYPSGERRVCQRHYYFPEKEWESPYVIAWRELPPAFVPEEAQR